MTSGKFGIQCCLLLTTYLGAALELLAVHPNHRRLGAGRALVEWGTKASDEQGVKVRKDFGNLSPLAETCCQACSRLHAPFCVKKGADYPMA